MACGAGARASAPVTSVVTSAGLRMAMSPASTAAPAAMKGRSLASVSARSNTPVSGGGASAIFLASALDLSPAAMPAAIIAATPAISAKTSATTAAAPARPIHSVRSA